MSRGSSQRRFVLSLAAVALGTGCFLAVQEPVATPCERDDQCPVDALNRPARCVAGAEGQKFCEVAFGSVTPPPAVDSGTPPTPKYYCLDVQKFMTSYCIACHTAATNVAGRTDFFLDHYETKTLADGGTEKGVYDMRDRVKTRSIDQFGTPSQMPPPSFALQPSLADRDALSAWLSDGAPYASGSAAYDPAVPCEAPASTVSFGQQIQPILDAKCASCHAYLTAAQAPESIVSKKLGCETQLNVVEPGSPENSFIWRKLVDDAGTRCGSKMPVNPSAPELPAAELSLIRTWIQEGAQNN